MRALLRLVAGMLLAAATQGAALADMLLVTNSNARHVSFVDPTAGVVARVEAGALPWGVAPGPDQRAYVATAEGVAIIDVAQRKRVALVPYLSNVGRPGNSFDEYRPGGEGIAVSPDGKRVYVGVRDADGGDHLELLDTATLRMIGRVPIGRRPFQVLTSADGREIYTLDHDSYSVSIIDAVTLARRVVEVTPEGRGAFNKPHYAARRADGKLVMPFIGRSVAIFDPRSGTYEKLPSQADTHQHGIALTPDEKHALIVGTGSYGESHRGASLALYDLQTRREHIIPLARPHEQVAVSRDGKTAYVTGGFTFHAGWSGITVVDLEKREVSREIDVPDLPLDIVLLP